MTGAVATDVEAAVEVPLAACWAVVDGAATAVGQEAGRAEAERTAAVAVAAVEEAATAAAGKEARTEAMEAAAAAVAALMAAGRTEAVGGAY